MRLKLTPSRLQLAAAVSLAVTAIGASAQESSGPRLEEVIVTAQKRVENLQDVPISVAAVTSEKLEKAGIENIEDLTAYLPNIHFTETGFSTQVRIRGIGSDNSQGFEQSVGMYVDGIYYGRAQLFRAPLMDMERAELLRGPQSTLFGKNSIAGALNLTTAKPTDEFEGRVSLSHEVEHAQTEANLVLSGPLTEDLRARLAIRSYDQDGYFTNNVKDQREPQSDELAVRLSVDWDASDDLSLSFKAERDTFDTVGRAIEITQDIPLIEGNFNYSEVLTNILRQPTGVDSDVDFVRQADTDEKSDNEINNYTFKAEYALGDYTLTAVTGWLDFNYDEACDCDFTGAEILDLDLNEDYEQISQEIRISSPLDGPVDWIAGIFYQEWDQEFTDQLNISNTNVLTALVGPQLGNTALNRDFTQESSLISLFGRATWHITDRFHVTLGARYTIEDKDATKDLNIVELSTGSVLDDSSVAEDYFNNFGVESEQLVGLGEADGHSLSGSRQETPFTPLINVEYDFNDDVLLYASFTSGTKAGGFDPRSNGKAFFEFEEENADAFEIGLKSTVADGRGEVNVSIYRTEYDDLQISQFDGRVGFNASNANETVVQGVEVDGRWAFTDNLTASYGMSYLDFEYEDFRNGNCFSGQTPDGVDLDGNGTLDTCDYTGQRGVYTPEFTLNVSFDYHQPLTQDVDFVALLDLQYIDEQQVHVNLDPSAEIDAYTTLSLRVGMETDSWSFAILGKNLLDEYVPSYSANAPLSDTFFATNTHYSFIKRPKTIAMEASYRF